MIRFVALSIFIAIVFGCEMPQAEVVQRIPFPHDEYQALNTSGTGVVRGQAFLKTRGGDVKTAAGNEVLLNPVTSYSSQWYEVCYQQNKGLSEKHPDYENYILYTTADADGRFTFNNVPAGKYYLTAIVTWDAAVGYQGALVQQGGYISKIVTVTDGSEIDIILTR